MKKILVIGTGGLAREFTEWFRDNVEIVGYWSTDHEEHLRFGLPGTLYTEDMTPDVVGTDLAVIAIGTPQVKKRMFDQFSGAGFSFPTVIHSSSEVSSLSALADGVVVSPQCVISPNVSIGKLAYINFCCGVGHDTVVGDFVQMNPGSQLGGFCEIGQQVLLGSGSTVLKGVSVGDRATVSSGAVVFGKVAQGATVMGNPAKRMRALE